MITINSSKPYKIFAEIVEQEALNQFESALNKDFSVSGALMPDVHTGYSLPIGAVIATNDVIVPSWVGYDIGCGMCAVKTTYNIHNLQSNAKDILNEIYKVIPVGFNHNQKNVEWENEISDFVVSDKLQELFNKNGLKQLCTLGGGNHFIEIGFDEKNTVWIIIHSGSRGIGHDIASFYMQLACGDNKNKEGHFGFDVNSNLGKLYYSDLEFCIFFALENRVKMLQRIENVMNLYSEGDIIWSSLINQVHNHVEKSYDDNTWIHRKGSSKADKGILNVIPGNMRDGSFIVKGKGNPESLYSSSHGAGRVLGRKQAKKTLNFDDYYNSMNGVTAKITKENIDESPFVYKNIFDVMKLQVDLVDILYYIKPIINIKG